MSNGCRASDFVAEELIDPQSTEARQANDGYTTGDPGGEEAADRVECVGRRDDDRRGGTEGEDLRQSIGRWKAKFLEAGKQGLIAGKSGPSTREQQLKAEVVDMTQALGEAAIEIRVWTKSAEGRLVSTAAEN